MILGNYSLLNKNPHKLLVSTGNLNKGSFWQPNTFLGIHVSEADGGRLRNASIPTGTEPPYCFVLAPEGGELSSTTSIRGTGDVAATLILGKVMEANLSGTGNLTASMSLISALSAALSGSGTITADLKTSLTLAANLVGSGDLTASLKLLIPLAASLSGVGAITANLRGNADLEAQIYVNQSEETVQQIVDAVWGALATDYNASGTMGQKLNGAGSAGDPWTTDLSTYNTANTAGLLMKKASKPKISL